MGQPDIITNITTPFFAQGILGSVCVALVLVIFKLYTEMKAERAAHKLELAAKDALIKELYDSRVIEAKTGYEVLKSNDKTMEAFFTAVNRRFLTE